MLVTMSANPLFISYNFVDYSAVFENLQDGLHIYQLEDINDDSTLRLVSANQAAADITGISIKDLIGKTLDENFPGLRETGIPQKYASVVRTQEPMAIGDVHYHDNRVASGSFAVKAFPLPENCLGVLFEDVTEQRMLEAELLKSRGQLQAFFDHMISGSAYHQILTNERGEPVDYIFLDVNKSFEQLTGLKRGDILGKKVTEVHPDIGNMDFDWIGTYGKVALTGEPKIFEQYFKPQNSWYLISAYCPQKGYFAVIFNDITDRKRTEDALLENEEQLSALIRRMPSGLVVYEAIENGRDFIIKRFNRGAEKIEKTDSNEVIGKRLSVTFPGAYELGLFDVLKRVWKTGKDEFLPESSYKDNNRLQFWRENWVYKLPSGDLVTVYNDITARKKNEEELREAIHHQKEIARAGNIGLWDWNLETNRVQYSAEWKKQIGYDDHEITDDYSEWIDRIHPDELEAVLESIQKSIADHRQDHKIEFRFRHKDGSYRWILARASVYQDESGKPIRMLGSHVDITERKEVEEELLQRERQLTELVDNMIDSFIVTNLQGVIRFVNNAACIFFGRKKEDLLGNELGLPVDLSMIFEITAHPPNGELRFAEAKAAVINWGDEQSCLISLRDITERRRAIEEREKTNAQMVQAQKMESIGNLAGGVAHDFNNMLSVILGYGEELVRSLESTDPLREAAQEIVMAGRRSADLTRQLLAFSRRQTLQAEVLDLNDIVGNLENVLRRLIEENIELKTFLTKDMAPVEVDPGQIEQVIVNLAVNGRDAMPEGGKLTIVTANVVLDERYADTHLNFVPGKYVMLSISDDGCGMDRETQKKIFEPFFTTKEKGKGTGLGLSTVYGIIKQSGGYIWVCSEPGQGTCFKIYLPVATRKHTKKAPSAKGNSFNGKGQMILVVEDEPSLRKLCKRILTSLNYQVTVAANGKEALALFEESNLCPDLIITDVVMPEMNGPVLIDCLQKILPAFKYIYMSGYMDKVAVSQEIINSGVPFIHKPFSKDKIGETIRSVLDEA
jgi:PAS domain S-box-containing protein